MVTMRNRNYWKRRFEALEDAQYRKGEEYYRDLQKQFAEASNSLQMDIERWYIRIAENNDISYASARKFLKESELKEFKWSLEEYIRRGEENGIDLRWAKELENASARYHISYLEAMKLQAQQHVELLSAQYENGMTEFLRKSYTENFYRTAYEIAVGTGIGHNLSVLDTKTIDIFINHPWAQDGKSFSTRIWSNKEKLINTLHTELSQHIIRGSSPRTAIDNMANIMNVSRNQAGTLILTESAAISSKATEKCYNELDVEEYEILATLDSRTSKICQDMDGKVFKRSEYKVGLTANPFHPRCRTTTVPYFDDEFTVGEERASRGGQTGRPQYVPANMTYPEWQRKYVIKEKEEQKRDIVISAKVDKKFVNSRTFKEKFAGLTDSPNVDNAIYNYSKQMLKHRDGTMFEDIYFIDKNTGKVVASSTDTNIESAAGYNKSIKKALSTYDMNNVIAIHNHPSSMPPSAGDFNAALKNGYHEGYIVGHDGTLIRYRAGREAINRNTYEYRLALERKEAYTEYEAQVATLNEMKKRYGIEFEVISDVKE